MFYYVKKYYLLHSPKPLRKNPLILQKNTKFKFDKTTTVSNLIKQSVGLSYFSIQKTLITAIKRSLFNQKKVVPIMPTIQVELWKQLLIEEKLAVLKT